MKKRRRRPSHSARVIELYLQRYVEKKHRLKTQNETKRYLCASWRLLHDVPLHQLARRDIAMQLTNIVDNSGAISADRARTALHGFFV